MLRHTRSRCAALLIGTLGMQAVAGEATAAPDASIGSLARATMQQYGIPGMSIGLIVDGNRRVCHYGVASLQSDKPVTGDTLFEIGSLSKLFAAALASVAQANGALALTEPPASQLDWLGDTALEGASLLNLATHTAVGLPLFVPDDVATERQVKAYFADIQPLYAAGTRRTYSNPGIGLLGMAAAASLGSDYRQAVRTHLFEPLNMAQTYFSVPQALLGDYAQGYTADGKPVRLTWGALADPAYGLKSTADDLLSFLEASLADADQQSGLGHALNTMQAGFFQVGPMTQALVWERYPYPVALDTLVQGNSSDMALGTHTALALLPPATDEHAWINKTGSTSGFAAYAAMLPAYDAGVVILANRHYPAEARIRLASGALARVAGEAGQIADKTLPQSGPRMSDASFCSGVPSTES